MPWVRIDDHFNEHPKHARVGPLAWGVWLAGLAYCNRNLTDGFIPRSVAMTLACFEVVDSEGRVWKLARTSGMVGEDVDMGWVIQLLVDAGLWEEVPGGYRVHDYHDYQPSREEVEAEREAARARMQRRRSSKKKANDGSCDVPANNAGSSGEVRANITRTSGEVQAEFGRGSVAPVPVPDPGNTPQETCVNKASSSLRSNTAGTGADDADQRMDGQADGGAAPAAETGGRGDADSPSRPLPGSVVAAEMMAEMTDEQRLIHDAYFAVTGRLLTSKDLECLHELLEIATPELIANTIREVGERARESGTKPRSLRYFADAVREAAEDAKRPKRRLDYDLPDPNDPVEIRRRERAKEFGWRRAPA